MKSTQQGPAEFNPFRHKPYAMLGSGNLTSCLWKFGSEPAGWRYRFNLFRMDTEGHVGQLLNVADVSDLVKLARVLAATLSEDGCLSPKLRRDLSNLATKLDELFDAKE